MGNAVDRQINPMPYTSIPGPSFLELIFHSLPGGKFYKKDIQEIMQICRKTYGDLMKIPTMVGIPNLVITHDPEHFAIVYRTEGQYPERRTLEIIEYYEEKIRPDIHVKYKGIFNGQGEEWGRVRKLANPSFMHTGKVQIYLPKINHVAVDFLERIRNLRDPTNNQLPENFEIEINRWALECMGVIALDERLGLLTDRSEGKAVEFMNALKEAFELGYDISCVPPVWKLIATSDYKKFVKAMNSSTDIVMEYIEKAKSKARLNEAKSTENNESLSILAKLMNIDENAAVSVTSSMFFSGVDTVSSAFVSILYALAKNEDKQDILRNEIRSALPEKNSQFSVENFQNLPYLRACIKESQRLYPTISNQLRSAGQDLNLNGYQIPRGTQIVMNASVLAQEEQYFSKAAQFIPERWLEDESYQDSSDNSPKLSNPSVFLPFGFGRRICIGRRFAEMELDVMTSMIIRNFKISWCYPELTFIKRIITGPGSNLMFTLTDIPD